MKLPAPFRLILGVLVVTAAVSLVWWLAGYQIGKAMLAGADAVNFKKNFGFEDGAFLRLAFFALAGAITVTAAAGGKSTSWLPLAGVAFGAATLFPDHGTGAIVGMILFVLSSAALPEMGGGAKHAVGALVAGIVVSIAFSLEGSFGRSELAVIAALRGVFWFFPLLVAPEYVERFILKKLA